MISLKSNLAFFVLLILICSNAYSQEGIIAMGEEAVGSTGSVSYTVGQIDYQSIGGSLYEGLQQPFEIQVISGIEFKEIHLSMSVYPNPASDYLTLRVDAKIYSGLTYTFHDMSGKVLLSGQIDSPETVIRIQEFAHGAYFLKVLDERGALKSFKIIKNN